MPIGDVLTQLNLTVDGRGYVGKIEEITLPKLMPKMQEFAGGGMAAPIDVPMGMVEKLECEFSISAYDPAILKLFGVLPNKVVQFTARGATHDLDGTVHAVVVNMRGHIKELDSGTWKNGDKATLKVGMSLRYYKLEHDEVILIECDPENLVLNVDGTDQLAATRAALAI